MFTHSRSKKSIFSRELWVAVRKINSQGAILAVHLSLGNLATLTHSFEEVQK